MAVFERRRRTWIIIASALVVAVVAIVIGVRLINARLTRYVESESFRRELEKETAKGLHFPSGHYEPIKRTGTWTAESAGFQATDGWKALRSMNASGITAKFNPWGVFRRLWQLDKVHVQAGEVGIQVYEPKPEPSPAKPWYAIFLPERVYLNWVESEPVDVTWRFRQNRSGFFRTRLLITPHGRDFEYQAREGNLRMSPFPELRLQHTHMLITKTILELYHLDLQPGGEKEGMIRAEGKAGTGQDRSVDFKIEMKRVPIDDWMPGDWREHVAGAASARVHWTGENPKLEYSGGEADLRIDGARIYGLPFLEKIARLTKEKELERLKLNVCQLDLTWRYPKIDIKHLIVEEKGKFRAEGEVIVRQESLRGTIALGVAPRLLDWLPVAHDVFPREHDGYLWTTVHLSGTVEAPQQDLSERIQEAIKEHPTAALTLLFRQIGESLRHAFGRE
jgi:hypothetical protein